MKLTAEEKVKFRRLIENELEAVPEGQRIHIDEEILEELLFDVISFGSNSIPPIKVPVWSGEFLSKIDLGGKIGKRLFENVSWNINNNVNFVDIFCGIHYEELEKQMGALYAELWEYVDKHMGKKGTVIYTNTNADIDFKKSWEYKMVGQIYISNCDFCGTNLSRIIDCQITIDKSNVSKTGIKLPTGKTTITETNLEGVDLSSFEIDFNDMANNYMFTSCNLRNTGIRIHNFSKKIIEKTEVLLPSEYAEEIKCQFQNGEYDGCYINGILMQSKEERQENSRQMREIYEQFRNDLINSTLTSIDDQIRSMKK